MLDKLEKFLVYDNVFLSGGAGVGKSFLTNELIRSYKRQGKVVIALGSSALSAFNIAGVTLHSFFVWVIVKIWTRLAFLIAIKNKERRF